MIPREEDESAEDYAYRLMQAVTSEQVRSFLEMVRAMREIFESAKRHRSDDSEDTDESNYQDATDRIKIKRIWKRVQAPIFKGIVGERPEPHLLRATDWFDSQGIKREMWTKYTILNILWMEMPGSGMLTILKKEGQSQPGLH